jgi:glycine/D-amino acid oxidase-like deaminating enzyme
MYADANQAGVAWVKSEVAHGGIECDLTVEDAYTCTADAGRVGELEAEVAAGQSLGLPATFESVVQLPTARAAVRFSDQAQFHPRRYCLGLAQAFIEAGGNIFDGTPVMSIETDGDCRRVVGKDGTVSAAVPPCERRRTGSCLVNAHEPIISEAVGRW